MKSGSTRHTPLAALCLILSGCASRPCPLPPQIPAELLADCVGVEETDHGTMEDNRAAIIECERDKNERSRKWVAEAAAIRD